MRNKKGDSWWWYTLCSLKMCRFVQRTFQFLLILHYFVCCNNVYLYYSSTLSSFTALQSYLFCSTILNKTSDKAALEMGASHQAVAGENLHKNALNSSQPTIRILNLLTKLDNVSLFYKNMYILSQDSHSMSIFNSYCEGILSKTCA